MNTEAIRRLFDECRGTAPDPGLAAAENVLDALELALAESEKREAVKDDALQQAALRFELLAIADIGMTNGVDPMAGVRDCHEALSTTKTDKVLVSVQKLQDTYQALNDACGDLEFGTDSYISVASVREWLFDIVEGGR